MPVRDDAHHTHPPAAPLPPDPVARRDREGLAREVVGFLADGVSVHLTGLAGSGRSHLLCRAADLLRARRRQVVRIAGIRCLSERPLATLAVAGLPLAAGQGAASLGAAVETIAQLVEPPGAVVLVDDSDDLDDVSLGALLAARARAPFPVLAVSRAGHRAPATAALGAQTQPAVRIHLDPLPLDQVQSLVHEMLPGLVEAATVARIATASGGLPALVRAVVSAGCHTGRLVQHRGIWRAGDDLWDPMLASAVEPLVQDLDRAALDALTTVAGAGDLTVGAATELVGPAGLTDLHRRGLLAVARSGADEVVGLFPPLLEDYLQREGAPTSAQPDPWRDALAGTLGPVTGQQSDATTDARSAPVLSRRVRQRWRRECATLHEGWLVEPCARTALDLVRALNTHGAEPGLIERVLAATDTTRDEPDERAALDAWAALWRALTYRDLEPADHRTAPAGDALDRAVRLHTELLLDRVPDARPEPPEAREPGLGRDAEAVARLGPLLAAGSVVDAGDRVRALSRPRTSRFLAEHRDAYAALAAVLTGDVEAGTATALRHVRRALRDREPDAVHAHAYVGALGLVLQGRLEHLDHLLGTVLTIPGATSTSAHFRAGLLGTGAQAAQWQGRDAYAAQLWSQGQDIGAGAGPFPGMLAFAPDAGTRPAELGPQLWDLAADRSARGYHAHALFLAATATDYAPDPRRAATVTGAARHAQGRLLPALARYVDAAGRGDAAALGAVVGDLKVAGSTLHATTAAVTRAVLLRARGDLAGAVEQADSAWDDAAGLGGARRALFAPLRAAVRLSAREREIVALLGDGVPGKRAATLLGVSHRTVEGHILRACRRIGADSRDRLATTARTWLL